MCREVCTTFSTLHDNLCGERLKNFAHHMPYATCHMRACTACLPVLLVCAVSAAFGLIARRCSSSSNSHGSDSWPKGWHQLLSAVIKAAAAAAFAFAATAATGAAGAAVCLGLTKFKFTTQRRTDLASALHPPLGGGGSSAVGHLCGKFYFFLLSLYYLYPQLCVCVCVTVCVVL